MTVVELFDKSAITNVASSLSMRPDKIIFLGSGKAMKRFDRIHQELLRSRGISTQVECRSIPLNSLSSILAELRQIVETEEQCIFDLTGGPELVLAAMGMVYREYPQKHIGLQRIRVADGMVTDCDDDGKVLYDTRPELTVEELIRLHGGAIRHESGGEERTYPWQLDEEFVQDIHTLWDISREDPGRWNAQVTALAGLTGDPDPEDLEVRIPLELLQERSGDGFLEELLDRLYDRGMICCYGSDGYCLSYSYKNAQIKKCLEKAGTVLELKVLATATELQQEDGTPFYTDAMAGVFIDWDGDLHESGDAEKDTENEIDVLLTKGLTPVFISCKNGRVEDEELYKLNTVADRFGGKNAKRVLIATYIGKPPVSLQYFRRRARDMKIQLIENAHLLSREEFARILKKAVST